ncbi:MAG: methyltransferase domain-containing protein [Actinobacteria bacterium]|jgi:SAM-dependent methyltransferase|nr:methyltransferase domain-containing protein [Actinomycetota bacterium]MSW77102.1 methyltransferase domain-containing protein [Actinomycetota bacterium]MSX54903.1 methyltransferase domain-containing protein [Actinomycetota bacterium]MSX93647.1 methyltransferase domain-containing protein [Actinomycetota bacterium]MSZ83030.1 methyltransferase domain-containing protein [Actinomycetota bacterium]
MLTPNVGMTDSSSHDGAMRGYHDASYGDAFADVYDEWYHGISDIESTTTTLGDLAAGPRVLELGVGTGRLAIPLAATGLEVHGLDTSAAMLEQLAAKDGSGDVVAHLGDMVDAMPDGPFGLVFVAYNTFFNLLSATRQQQCFAAAAARLGPQGCFVIEAFVPDPQHDARSGVSVRSVAADRVVLSVSTSDPERQQAEGQYVDITESGGVRLRPWSIRWATPAQLDEMAGAAGLQLRERWESFDRTPFGMDSERHVSVYSR